MSGTDMRLSTQLDFLGRTVGEEDGIRHIAAAGFDAFDLTLFRMMDGGDAYEMNGDGYRDRAKHLRAAPHFCTWRR